MTDPAGKWKKYTLDAMGNLVQVSEPGGLETYYTYNAVNQLVQVRMPRGAVEQIRTFTYNGDLRLASVTNPETGTTSYTYNGNGTVATRTDAKGQVTSYSYDTSGRLTQVNRGSCEQVTTSWDSQGYAPGFSVYTTGRVAATQTVLGCTGLTVTEVYSYTVGGLVAKKRLRVKRFSGNDVDLDGVYGYNNEGQVTTLQYPATSMGAGPVLTQEYDEMGRLKRVFETQDRLVEHVRSASYGAAGQDVYLTETTGYNERLQMTGMVVPGAVNLEYRYAADQNNGRITQRKNWVSGEEVSYAYDELNRLITAATTGPEWGLAWSYDGFGNRGAQTVTKGSAPTWSGVVDGATNRVVGSGYSYDANGNATSLPGVGSMTYDYENRLLTASGESYQYGPDNKRVWKKKAGGGEEIYFYGVSGQLLGVYELASPGGVWQATTAAVRVWFGGKLIGKWVGWTGAAVVTDRLGSVVWDGGTVLDYWPYGEEKPTTTGQEKEKFATYYRDATGLDYADQRYYSHAAGRFLTADPYQAVSATTNPSEWNRYLYVIGDPVNFNDPSGLQRRSLEFDPRASTFRMNCIFHPGAGGAGGSVGRGGGWGVEHAQLEAMTPGDLTLVAELSSVDRARSYLEKAKDAIRAAVESNQECAALFTGGAETVRKILDGLRDGALGGDGDVGVILFGQWRVGDAYTEGRRGSEVAFADGRTLFTRVDISINASAAGSGFWNQAGDRGRARILFARDRTCCKLVGQRQRVDFQGAGPGR